MTIAVIWADALLRTSLQSGLFAVAAWGILRFVPAVSAGVRSWIWRLVAFKFILALAVTIPIESASVSVVSASAGPPTPLATGVLLLSACGALYLAACTLLDMRLAREAVKCSHPASSRITEVAHALRLPSVPPIRVSEIISVPALVGLRRPVILLPVHFVTIASDEELRMVLAHEMAHLRRRDLAWAWLGVALRSIFFFHPLAWLAWRESQIADEAACDELALKSVGASRRQYGQLILRLATGQPLTAPSAASVAGNAESVRRRLDNLVRSPQPRTGVSAVCLILALAAVPGYRTVAQPISPFVVTDTEPKTIVSAADWASKLGRRAPVPENTHRESRK